MRRALASIGILLLGLLVACSTPSPKGIKPTPNAIVNEEPLIAYPARRNGRWDLHVVDIETGQDRIITAGLDNVRPFFDWSPDGSRIVLTTGTAQNNYDNELFLIDVRDGAVIQLTDNEEMDRSPHWSPDGKWIAFQSSLDADGGSEIWLINPDSRELKTVVNDPSFNENALNDPLWSPDMSMILVSGYAGMNPTTISLLVIDVQSGRVIREIGSRGAEILGRAWSPDSTSVVYVSDRDGTYDVFVASVTDGEDQESSKLAQLPGQEVLVFWSPDDRKILFTSYLENDFPSYKQQIYTIDVETLELHPLTEIGPMVGAGWSPDGKKIVTVIAQGVIARGDDTYFVGVMNADGSDLKILEETASEAMLLPKWNPASK